MEKGSWSKFNKKKNKQQLVKQEKVFTYNNSVAKSVSGSSNQLSVTVWRFAMLLGCDV